EFDVVAQAPVTIPLPQNVKSFVGAVAVDLIDASGKRLACNYTNVVFPSVKPSLPKAEWKEPFKTLVVRFAPSGFAANTFKGARTKTGKFTATGAGAVEYHIAVPPALRGKRALVLLQAEVAA